MAGAVGAVGGAAGGEEGGVRGYRFVFEGSTGAFFRIWWVNMLLTVATLGIYSAWAKVRTRRYFYGNTFLDGASFEYHASPWSILAARVVVVALLVGGAVWAGNDVFRNATHSLLLVLLVPWAVVRGLAFNARYSSYRHVRFGFARANAVYARAYLIYFPVILLVLVQYLQVLGVMALEVGFAPLLFAVLMLPFMQRAYHGVRARNHRWGRAGFGFAPRRVGWYLLACWGLPLAAAGVFGGLAFLGVAGVGAAVVADVAVREWAVWGGLVVGAWAAGAAVFCVVGALLFKLYWRGVALPGGGEVVCRFSAARFGLGILWVNLAATVLSLGALYPWARVRRVRFLAENVVLVLPAGVLDEVLDDRARGEGALGQEFDAAGFDFDVGLI